MISRRLFGRRDQAPSSFAPTLGRLCSSAGVVGAALVDADGEAVDYAGRVDSFDIRVSAAEWRIILARLGRSSFGPWRGTHQLMVRGVNKSFGAVLLPEGYALVVQLLPRCFRVSPRALSEAVREICENAGLELPQNAAGQWRRVQVNESPAPQRRPESVWVNRKWLPVEVLGRWVDPELLPNEIGYRVRLLGGEEITLVREPLAQWFADPGAALQ
ncbi:MAG TPA: hypothetical protein VFQ61_09760 [Polyangiaceae bacterium]|nr:hypothetical protein [Polyangiaceae bacterium]